MNLRARLRSKLLSATLGPHCRSCPIPLIRNHGESVGSDEPPIILRPRKLDAHRKRIAQMLAEFDGNVVKVHRALADVGTSVRYSTLTAFCRNKHLLDGACDAKRSVVAARQWLLELINGAHTVERLQSQLPHATDLVGIELGRAGVQVEGYHPRPFGMRGGCTVQPWPRFPRPPDNPGRPNFSSKMLSATFCRAFLAWRHGDSRYKPGGKVIGAVPVS